MAPQRETTNSSTGTQTSNGIEIDMESVISEAGSYTKTKKTKHLFMCQVLIALIVIIAAIINLSLPPTVRNDNLQAMWIALLSSTLGYMMPSPSVKNMVPVLKK